jgi:para-nitrobenzyl esterase
MTIINTKSGKVQGFSEGGLLVFKGIPYGEPPVGKLRFSTPVTRKNWDDVFDATQYGCCAYQGYSALQEYTGKLQPESEDCLNLNIWTPGTEDAKRPVMFWIHGGAFITGGGIAPIYDGSSLSKRGDIVVVTINYRLGALGYLYIPGVTVNVGLLDQVLALKWVHENIVLFGGDPNNVTIFGESAGAYSVVALPAMPTTKGLFKRARAESAPVIDPKVTEKPTKTLMRSLGVGSGDIDALRTVSVEKIIEAQNKITESELLAFRPFIDGKILPKHPLKAFQEGACKDIDFMIGTNLDEAKLFTALDPKLRNMNDEKMIIGFLGMMGINLAKGKEIVEKYKEAREGKYSTEPNELFNVILTDFMFRISTTRLLEAQSAHNPSTYNYMFTWPSPLLDGKLGTCHALEIPFVFNNLNDPAMKAFVGDNPKAEDLSTKMMDAWIAFACNGNPNHDGIPHWPPYDAKSRATLFFGEECKVINAAFEKERVAWKGLQEI